MQPPKCFPHTTFPVSARIARKRAAQVPDEDASVADRGRKLDEPAGLDRPERSERRPVAVIRCDVGAGGVVAVHRPRDFLDDATRSSLLAGACVVTNSTDDDPRTAFSLVWSRIEGAAIPAAASAARIDDENPLFCMRSGRSGLGRGWAR